MAWTWSRAANKLVGYHYFRNFCRIDLANGITNFKRRILYFRVSPVAALNCEDENGPHVGDNLYQFTICGRAFLWHQVRYMSYVLFAIGRGEEDETLVDALLDAETCTGKPDFKMADDVPLVLHDCGYEDIHWRHSLTTHTMIIEDMRKMWRRYEIKAMVARSMLRSLREMSVYIDDTTRQQLDTDFLYMPWHKVKAKLNTLLLPVPSRKKGTSSKKTYVKIMDRTRSKSFNQRWFDKYGEPFVEDNVLG